MMPSFFGFHLFQEEQGRHNHTVLDVVETARETVFDLLSFENLNTMATPKTPFRPRRSSASFLSGSSSRKSTTPPVLGVVSKDSVDGDNSQTTPQPSPVQPPAPQTRQPMSNSMSAGSGSRRSDQQADSQSLAESIPSQPEEPPPSPYSPPPESLWSENTENQWPYNHTKRQFQRNAIATEQDADTVPLSSRSDRQFSSAQRGRNAPTVVGNESSSSGDTNNARMVVPPLPAEVVTHKEPTATASSARGRPRNSSIASATPMRQNRVQPPSRSSNRRFDTNNTTLYSSSDNNNNRTPSTIVAPQPEVGDSEALFLLEEEHKVLQSEYTQMEKQWQDAYEALQRNVDEKDQVLKNMQATLLDREEMILELRDTVDSVPRHFEQELEAQKEEFQREMEEKSLQHDNLVAAFEALQQEKDALESELNEQKEVTGKDQEVVERRVATLQKEYAELEKQRETLQKKVNQYEDEIVRQSNRIFELEESLAETSDAATQNLISVQSEASEKSNALQAEKEALQREVQKLREQLADKDRETAVLLDEQRRQQIGKISDLERQVHFLTNTLAEWQGRHAELRTTVDQHLQFKRPTSAEKSNPSVACQTDHVEASKEDEEISSTHVNASKSSPSTPSVRFVETVHVSKSNESMTPLSMNSQRQPSPRVFTYSDQSVTNGTSNVPQHSISHTPSSEVSPWIPVWTGRSLHNRADPPPSCTSKSGRSLSPPATKNDHLSPGPPARRDVKSAASIEDETGDEEQGEVFLEDRVYQTEASETTPSPTVQASNLQTSFERQQSTEKVRPGSLSFVYFFSSICLSLVFIPNYQKKGRKRFGSHR